jgi:hypothetical protein
VRNLPGIGKVLCLRAFTCSWRSQKNQSRHYFTIPS